MEREESYEEIFNARGHLYNEAGSKCPEAREAERAALLDLLAPKAGETIVDAPAGGGYVAEGLRRRLGDAVRVICIEPAERFGAAIQPEFERRHEPLERTSLASGSVDAVASLAGLHHFRNKRPVYCEWHRILKPGGRLVVADVQVDTPTAEFLNGFVHSHTPGGHEGIFVQPGEWSRELEDAGFAVVSEELLAVPWRFPDALALEIFCHRLFGVTKADPVSTGRAIAEILGTAPDGAGGCQMAWQLRYVCALRG